MAKIYVASSWRNQYYTEVVEKLRSFGHEVYDFRNPPHGQGGFKWQNVDPDYQNWTFQEYMEGLGHPSSRHQFKADLDALKWADVCVLVLPCGRSAHTEAGWMKGSGKMTVVYMPEMQEPELMYKLFDLVSDDMDRINECIKGAWTSELDAELKKLWNQGMSVYDLAGHFGRKDVDVRTRLGKLGM